MSQKIKKLTLMGLMIALCFIGFQFLKIRVPIGGTATAIHLGNTFCILAALLLGGVYGGIAGAVGMGIADVLDPTYITSAPITLILKMIMGLIAGGLYKVLRKKNMNEFGASSIASAVALIMNTLLTPIVRSLYNYLIFSKSADILKLYAVSSLTTSAITSLITLVAVVLLFVPLKTALTKNKLI